MAKKKHEINDDDYKVVDGKRYRTTITVTMKLGKNGVSVFDVMDEVADRLDHKLPKGGAIGVTSIKLKQVSQAGKDISNSYELKETRDCFELINISSEVPRKVAQVDYGLGTLVLRGETFPKKNELEVKLAINSYGAEQHLVPKTQKGRKA